MAGHSQFKNIMHRKNAQDAKKAKVFTRLQHEIFVAAKKGTDPETNAHLRSALAAARQANLPKENIERTLKKLSEGQDADMFEALRHEGFGPENVAIIVEVLTDNRNRSISELRTIFSKNGGKIAERNAASFVFSHVGSLGYTMPASSQERLMMTAVDLGAQEFLQEDTSCTIFCPKEALFSLHEHLEKEFGPPEFSQLVWKPETTISVSTAEHWESLQKLLHALDDQADVQAVWHNGVPPEGMAHA